MSETNVHNIFPTPIWVIDLEPELFEGLNTNILRNFDQMIGERPSVPVGDTLQTDNDLHTFEEFAELTYHIIEGVRGFLEFLKVDHTNFEITGCWGNINPVGGINTPHTHPNNYLSGVYYVQTMEGADSIFFSDPRPQAVVVRPPVSKENIYSGNEVSMEAKDGRLLIFPAWLSHGVPPNHGNQDRVSISFNIMFSNYTESMSKPPRESPIRLKSSRS